MALFGGSKPSGDDYAALIAKGDLEGAIKVLRKLSRRSPDDFALGLQLSETLERFGRRDDAAAELIRVADGQEARGHHTKALALYRRAEKLAPDHAELKKKIANQDAAAPSAVRSAIDLAKKKSSDDAFDIDMGDGEPAPVEDEMEIGEATLNRAAISLDDDISADDLPPVSAEPEELATPEIVAKTESDAAPEFVAPEPPPVKAAAPPHSAAAAALKPAPTASDTAALLAASAAAEGETPGPAEQTLGGILADLTVPEAVLVVEGCMVRTYEPGERIISEGEPGDSMYFIRSGLVKVSTATPAGMVELGELKPGDYFGEVSLLNRVKRTATISALELTEVLVLDRKALDQLRPQIPDLIEKLEHGLQNRAKATIAAIQKHLGG